MKTFSTSIEIDAPTAQVWAIMRDVERWPEWTPTITSVQQLDAGPFGVGSRVEIRQPKLPPAKWQVTELREGHEFTWVSRSPGILVTARHEVAATGGGTHATLSIRYEGLLGSLLAQLTRNINERYLDLEANGLKKRSETSSPVAPSSEKPETVASR